MASTVVILGSPRKGNSEAIAMAIANEAKAKGNTIKEYRINSLKNIKGCQSCYGCKKAGKCVVKDDITPILDDIREADSIVVATPLYFGHATAQYRTVEDRFFGFLGGDFVPNIAAGKKAAIVVTCGTGLEVAQKTAAEIEGVLGGFFKMDVVGKIVKGGMMAPNAAESDAAVMAEAKAIGQKL
jgi:Multimeric flavodoxin WrbA